MRALFIFILLFHLSCVSTEYKNTERTVKVISAKYIGSQDKIEVKFEHSGGCKLEDTEYKLEASPICTSSLPAKSSMEVKVLGEDNCEMQITKTIQFDVPHTCRPVIISLGPSVKPIIVAIPEKDKKMPRVFVPPGKLGK